MRCLTSRIVIEKLLANGIVFDNVTYLANSTTLVNINKKRGSTAGANSPRLFIYIN